MSEHEDPQPDPPSEPPQPVTRDVAHHPVSARVPEHVSGGIFCTGAMVLQAQDVKKPRTAKVFEDDLVLLIHIPNVAHCFQSTTQTFLCCFSVSCEVAFDLG